MTELQIFGKKKSSERAQGRPFIKVNRTCISITPVLVKKLGLRAGYYALIGRDTHDPTRWFIGFSHQSVMSGHEAFKVISSNKDAAEDKPQTLYIVCQRIIEQGMPRGRFALGSGIQALTQDGVKYFPITPIGDGTE